MSTDEAGARVDGFSMEGVEEAGVSGGFAAAGGIEEAWALANEFVVELSAWVCALSTGDLACAEGATKDSGLNGEPLVGEPLAGEAFSAWGVIARGCP
jgi:hypothetical protein